MHQSLSMLSNRVVVDTNVLLNAAFVADSSARHSIEKLSSMGFSVVIDEAIEREASLVLNKLRIKLGLLYDPLEIYRAYILTSRILCLPAAPRSYVQYVNKADQHIIGAASSYNAWILTGDIKLAAQCQKLQIVARLPWDAIMEAGIRESEYPPLHYILRVAGLSAKKGSFFARVISGSWGGRKSVGRFTVCEVENIGRIYYDTANEEWVFSTVLGANVNLKCPIGQGEHWIVSVTYEMKILENIGIATLRAAQPFGQSIQKNISFKGRFTALTPGNITFGHSCAQNDYWNGGLRKVVLSPITIDAKAWHALIKVPEAAPDPASGDILESALLRVQIAADRLTIPSELWFRESWL